MPMEIVDAVVAANITTLNQLRLYAMSSESTTLGISEGPGTHTSLCRWKKSGAHLLSHAESLIAIWRSTK